MQLQLFTAMKHHRTLTILMLKNGRVFVLNITFWEEIIKQVTRELNSENEENENSLTLDEIQLSSIA